MQKKRCIVTGSDGFVGSHLRSKLQSEGVETVPIDISTGIDITNWELLKEFNQKVDAIFHLAARTFIPSTNNDPRGTYLVNLIGTLNLLELARITGAQRFIFASAYVYGNPHYLPIDEDHPINPSNPYNRSKALGEQLCRAYCEDYGLHCTIIRAFNIYGEGQRDDFLIPSIFKQLNNDEIVLKDPSPKRDFIHVSDVVEAYVRAAEQFQADFRIYNIGSGVSHSVDEIVSEIIRISGHSIKVRYLHESRPNEIPETLANISRAQEELSWQPSLSLKEGLRRYHRWIIGNSN